MRKALAILLLVITLYNVGGYLLAFQYFIYRADKFNEAQISKDRYKESELIEIKIPVRLPGIDSWRGYEKVSGSVQLQENAYNYVRMKMTPDTIYVMCIPNYKTTRLLKDNVICAREVSEAPFNAKKHLPQVKPVKIIECINKEPFATTDLHYDLNPVNFGSVKCKIIAGTANVLAPPPKSFLS